MRTFMSVPSRDLIISIAPSTLSMVPRMRTVGVGGCCAQAAVPTTDTVRTAANARGSSEEIFGMAFSSPRFVPVKAEHRHRGAIPGRSAPSHRRGQAVAADADAVGLKTAVGQLFHEGDHLGTRLQ